jgi:hypothetical protein
MSLSSTPAMPQPTAVATTGYAPSTTVAAVDHDRDQRRVPIEKQVFDPTKESYASWSNRVLATLEYLELDHVVLHRVPHLHARSTGHSVLASISGAGTSDVDSDSESVATSSSASSSRVPPSVDPALKRASLCVFDFLTRSITTAADQALMVDAPRGDAFEVWRRLREKYNSMNQMQLLIVTTQLANAKMGRSENILEFGSRLRGYALKMHHMGTPIGAPMLIAHLLNGLHAEYDPLQPVWASTSPTFETIVAAGQAHEMRSKQRETHVDSAYAASASVSKPSPHQSRDVAMFNDTGMYLCHRCDQPNHRAPDCTNPAQTCATCGRRGHNAKRCHSGPSAGAVQAPAAGLAGSRFTGFGLRLEPSEPGSGSQL